MYIYTAATLIENWATPSRPDRQTTLARLALCVTRTRIGWPLQLIAKVHAGMQRRRTYHDLLASPDCLLRDIGVTRSELVVALKRPLI